MAGMQPAAGMVLIARPSLTDPNFMRTVVYLLEHNESGSVGLIVNRPLPLGLGELWEGCPKSLREVRCCGEGGPVERNKGLLLHGHPGVGGSIEVGMGLAVGGDGEALLERLQQSDPDARPGPRLFLGHSGWGAGQLQEEIAGGTWLVRRSQPELLLQHDPAEDLWDGLMAAGDHPPQPGFN